MARRRKEQTGTTVSLRRGYPWLGILLALGLLYLGWYHYQQLAITFWRFPVIIVSFVWLTITIVLAHLNFPCRNPTPKHYQVAVVVPNNNEDPVMLRAMLDSLTRQSYQVSALYLVENGETDGSAERVFNEWRETTNIPRCYFFYREEAGKREAQAVAFRYEQDEVAPNERAMVFVTVDGDTRLDERAIENGLRPFADSDVMSVAGLLVGQNNSTSLLTRVLDLGFVSSFMNGRAAWSTLGSVGVNCGGLAFYRASVVWQHLEEYLSQTVMGRKASSGDDRMLTGLAALNGKTVFQETSVGFTLLPENMTHLTKQRGRWWRSFWWGGLWLIRRANPNRMIWWLVFSQYFTFLLYAVMWPLVLLVDPIMNQQFPWMFFLYISGLSYLRSARTLAVRRSDEPFWKQLVGYVLLSPLVTLLNIWLCTVLQWWGLLTFSQTGWKTRQGKVEVAIKSA